MTNLEKMAQIASAKRVSKEEQKNVFGAMNGDWPCPSGCCCPLTECCAPNPYHNCASSCPFVYPGECRSSACA